MSHAVSMVLEITSCAACERSESDYFYQAMVEGRELMDKAVETVVSYRVEGARIPGRYL